MQQLQVVYYELVASTLNCELNPAGETHTYKASFITRFSTDLVSHKLKTDARYLTTTSCSESL
jgi:hypothetical protein